MSAVPHALSYSRTTPQPTAFAALAEVADLKALSVDLEDESPGASICLAMEARNRFDSVFDLI